jgi:hypothetical protein
MIRIGGHLAGANENFFAIELWFEPDIFQMRLKNDEAPFYLDKIYVTTL